MLISSLVYFNCDCSCCSHFLLLVLIAWFMNAWAVEPTLCSVISSRLANSVRAHHWGPKIKIRRTERKDGRERLGTNFLSITWDKINSCFTPRFSEWGLQISSTRLILEKKLMWPCWPWPIRLLLTSIFVRTYRTSAGHKRLSESFISLHFFCSAYNTASFNSTFKIHHL